MNHIGMEEPEYDSTIADKAFEKMSISYEEAVTLGDPVALGEEKIMDIDYLFTENATTIVQAFWEVILTVRFYNLKYCPGPLHPNTVCLWHIKPKRA